MLAGRLPHTHKVTRRCDKNVTAGYQLGNLAAGVATRPPGPPFAAGRVGVETTARRRGSRSSGFRNAAVAPREA